MAKETLGIIGGSGLETVLAEHIEDAKKEEVVTPFGKPSSEFLIGNINDRKIVFLNRHGKGHRFDPSSIPYRANFFALKLLGVKSCIASGAVGSLREEIHPRDLVLVDQIIDKTFKRENSFFTAKAAVHCELAQPYCPRLRELLLVASEKLEVKTHTKATYVCMEGPQFSTRAESLMHRNLGGDLIGMTAMPEARLAREAQMCFALVAMPSDYDCWREVSNDEGNQNLIGEIIGNLNSCSANFIKLIKEVSKLDDQVVERKCKCNKSLEQAIWSDPKEISPDAIEILEVLKGSSKR